MNILGIPRQLAGRAFRSNLFGDKKSQKKYFYFKHGSLNSKAK